MSDNGNSTHHRPPPSPSHRVERGKSREQDWEVGFYPGFASHISVNQDVIYRQGEKEFFVLPNGSSRPLSAHAIEITNHSKSCSITLHVDDPHHVVDQIIVRLRDPKSEASRARSGGGVNAHQANTDTVTIDNTPTLCPPMCGGSGTV